MPALFVALAPDAALSDFLRAAKRRTRELVGPQLYLDDPPHLTLFLAAFPDEGAALGVWDELRRGLTAPSGRLIGWHVFAADPLTGNETLVGAVAPEDKERLRGVQARVLDLVAPRRDEAATAARFAARLPQLSAEQRTSLQRCGFPYTGAGWEPHFTVASIRAADWPAAWAALRNHPPSGPFACPRLQLYRLDDGHPTLVRSDAL
jgi:2'-5' RNA ligase